MSVRRVTAAGAVLVFAFVALSNAAEDSSKTEQARAVAAKYLAVHATELGVDETSGELRESSATAVSNSTIFRYQYLYEEVPVHGAEVILDVDDSVKVKAHPLKLRRPLSLGVEPKIGKEAAIRRAWSRYSSKPEAAQSTAALEVLPARTFRDVPPGDALVWCVSVSGEFKDGTVDEVVFIDASDGSTVFVENHKWR